MNRYSIAYLKGLNDSRINLRCNGMLTDKENEKIKKRIERHAKSL